MIVTKIFSCTIDVPGSELYSQDMETIVKKHLNNKYLNTCHGSSRIIEILSIVKKSECMMNKHSNNGDGTIDIVFKASVVVLSPYEIIHSCTVLNIDAKGVIICSSEHAEIAVLPTNKSSKDGVSNKIWQRLEKGHIIPVMVGGSKYENGKDKATVMAVPFGPIFTPLKYVKISKLTDAQKKLLQPLYDSINAEEALHEKIPKPVWKFFDDLLYPYKNDTITSSKKVKFQKVNILKNLDISGIVTKHIYTKKTDPDVFVYSQLEISDDNAPIIEEMDSEEFYRTVLNNYLITLYDIRRLCEVYNTEKLRTDYSYLWNAYNEFKK